MINVFGTYFRVFLSPKNKGESDEISYLEVMGVSWGFHFISAMYSVLSIYLGVKSYEYISGSDTFSHMVLDRINFTAQKFMLMMILFQVIFYPFFFQFSYRFWKFILKFYADIFESKATPEELNDQVEDVIKTMFTPNIFLMIPVFGSVLSYLGQIYYLFVGLLSKMSFSRLQAFLVLLTPLFILFLLSIFVASYFFFIISLLMS